MPNMIIIGLLLAPWMSGVQGSGMPVLHSVLRQLEMPARTKMVLRSSQQGQSQQTLHRVAPPIIQTAPQPSTWGLVPDHQGRVI